MPLTLATTTTPVAAAGDSYHNESFGSDDDVVQEIEMIQERIPAIDNININADEDDEEDESFVDEWIFSIQLPNNQVMELRQVQPPHPTEAPVVQSSLKNSRSQVFAQQQHAQQQIHGKTTKSQTPSSTSSSDDGNHKENEFLLPSSSVLSLGWQFVSPFWKLQSDFVLQVTYRPAWQAISEFTECKACSGFGSNNTGVGSTLRTIGSYCCGGGCGCSGIIGCCSKNQLDQIDYYCHTWTAADVTKAERLATDLTIPGIGECQALKLTLAPLSLPDSFPQSVPPYLQQAYQRHKQRLGQGRRRQQQQPQQQIQQQQEIAAPTITFCLPRSHVDPPLLWKVHFPGGAAISADIAVETYTILDGTVVADAPAEPPTHVFINGFQSWSFAGSIVRGREQPQPALPQAFSRAFNLGGTLPPSSAVGVVSAATASHPQAAQHLSLLKKRPPPAYYQSDFFTCITSDGQAVEPRLLSIASLQNVVDKVRVSQIGDVVIPGGGGGQVRHEQDRQQTGQANIRKSDLLRREDPFPFQKLDETGGPAIILGWLAQREQFGIVTADKLLQKVQMHASADGAILPATPNSSDGDQQPPLATASPSSLFLQETDWAYCQIISPHSYDEEPMVHYLHAVAAHNQARPLQNGDLLTGWCSWYHYYNNITETNLASNFEMLAAMKERVPMNSVVVDDGYMTAWGDWDSLKPGKFDKGMDHLASQITSHGMRPGLWLAPFTADKNSVVTSRHPDWVICNDFGAAANSGNCGKFFFGLDATNPNVRKHSYEAIRRAVHDWHYNILKIDFLYAACLEGNGKFDLSMTRAQAMHLALDTIRYAAGPDVFLIGCGCPIATGIGYVDGMRISPDTGPTWYPAPPLPWWDHGTLPCLRSMVRNSMSRAPFGHRWWHNDPDCLLLGESTRLSDAEVASAASVVAMTCGMMLLSDDLSKVSMSRMRILAKIFPMTGSSAVVLDLHSTNDGLPSLLRLWATDRHDNDFLKDDPGLLSSSSQPNSNREATLFARMASFQLDDVVPPPNERKRSCIYAPKGLGSWTIVSISNWSDKTAVLHVPPPALLPPPLGGFDEKEADTFLETPGQGSYGLSGVGRHDAHGYHVLSFWSSKYTWLPPQHQGRTSEQPLSRRLEPHETEIFHVKRVSPDVPQYVGSDLHFSCCREISSFAATKNSVQIALKTDYNRVGHIFVFVPVINTSNIRVTVNGEPGHWIAVGNTPKVGDNGSPRLVGRVIRVRVVVRAGGQAHDGKVSVDF